MKKTFNNRPSLLPFFVLVLISSIPSIFSWGRLMIGGDMMIPFNSSGLEEYLYQWMNFKNGEYYAVNYYSLYLFYKFWEFWNLDFYTIAAILQFSLNIIAGLGIYKLARLVVPQAKKYFYIVPITLYVLSPAFLNGWHYMYTYAFIPWFIYFIFKIVLKKEAKITDIISLAFILFFTSVDLPNPKYIFHLHIIAFLIFLISLALKLIDFNFIKENVGKIILYFLLSAYLFLPLIYFSFNYEAVEYGVYVKSGYKAVGQMMDYGMATMDRMVRLHQNGLNLNIEEAKEYLSNTAVIFLSYFFIIAFIYSFIKRKKNEERTGKIEIMLFILILVYLAFAAGPNLPLGFFYEYAVSHFGLFAFLRTTAGAVFFLSVFYSLYLLIFIQKAVKKKEMFFLSLGIILFLAYPFINGDYYRNFSGINRYANSNEFGFRIPADYLEMKDFINSQKLDAKTLYPYSRLSYINLKWGYFGPILYNFLYTNYNIGKDGIIADYKRHNIAYIFEDRFIIDRNKREENKEKLIEKSFWEDVQLVQESDYIKLSQVGGNEFLPHIYSAKNCITTGRNQEETVKKILAEDERENMAIFFYSQNFSQNEEMKKVKEACSADLPVPTIEYKKINPTKYRIRIHQAGNDFPLVFSEKFHSKWKIFLSDNFRKKKLSENMAEYKILEWNENSQAGEEELKQLIKNGVVSDLGDGKEKEISHTKWENDREKKDHKEKYTIDFISHNYHGTIQNDNLPKGSFYETWFASPISNNNHLAANGYANSWVIPVEDLCANSSQCLENADGTYDFELILEFTPQKVFYIGVLISLITLLSSILYLGKNKLKARK